MESEQAVATEGGVTGTGGYISRFVKANVTSHLKFIFLFYTAEFKHASDL